MSGMRNDQIIRDSTQGYRSHLLYIVSRQISSIRISLPELQVQWVTVVEDQISSVTVATLRARAFGSDPFVLDCRAFATLSP